MTSAAFTINGSAVPQTTGIPVIAAYGSTVTLALSSVVGANSIQWAIAGTSGSTVTAPNITRAGSPLGATATFTFGADPGDGGGMAYGVRCRVTDGAGVTYESHGMVGAADVAGFVPLAIGEDNGWRHATAGWLPAMNQRWTRAGATALARASYDATIPSTVVTGSTPIWFTLTPSVPLALATLLPAEGVRAIQVDLGVLDQATSKRDTVSIQFQVARLAASYELAAIDGVGTGVGMTVSWASPDLALACAAAADPTYGVLEMQATISGANILVQAKVIVASARTIVGRVYHGVAL